MIENTLYRIIDLGWDTFTDIIADVMYWFLIGVGVVFLWPFALIGWIREKKSPKEEGTE